MTTLKHQYTHALHLANAADHLRELPRDGESLHCVMRGNYNAWDLVPAVLRLAAPSVINELLIATLSFNLANAQELSDLIDAGQVKRVDFICSRYFKESSQNEYAFLRSKLSARGQRVVAIRSHAKILLFALSDGRKLTIEASANLRSCRNVEQFALTHDAGLFAFHRRWMTELIDAAQE